MLILDQLFYVVSEYGYALVKSSEIMYQKKPPTYLLSENNMKTVPHKTKQSTDFFHNNFFLH